MPKAKNYMHASKVDRLAIVPKGAVPDAEIVVFKSRKKEDATSGAIEYQDMPIAKQDQEWNPVTAVANVLKWAAGPGKEKGDFSKVQKAFMWGDPKKTEDITGYKFLKADIIDGELTVVPRAVIGIVGAMTDKGIDIPEGDKLKVLKHCKEIYNKMDTEFPEITVKVFEKGMMEMGFMRGFIVRGTQAAVYSLEDIVWDTMYGYANEEQMVAAFADFKRVINDVLAKLVMKTKADDTKLTQDDVIGSFARGLKISIVAEAFAYFSSHLVWLLLGQDEMEEPEKTINAVIELFEKFVTENVKEIVASKSRKTDEGTQPVDKIGRKISAARIANITSAVTALNLVLEEAESQASKSQEDDNMFDQEKFDALSVTVDGIVKSMKESGAMLTEDERIAYDKAIVDKQAKADLSARAVVVGLKEDATEAEIFVKEKEVQETADKAKKDAQDVVDKEKTEAEARITAQDAKIEAMGKTMDAVADAVGVKKSIDGEPENTDKNKKTKADPFGNVCKGKGLPKKEADQE